MAKFNLPGAFDLSGYGAAPSKTAEKAAAVEAASEEKSIRLNPTHVEDADTIFSNAFNTDEDLRFASPRGETFDAYEVEHDDKWLNAQSENGRFYNREKMDKQREALSIESGIPAAEITNKDIFARGAQDRESFLKLAEEGSPRQEFQDAGFSGPTQDPVVDINFTGEKGFYGRDLVGVKNSYTGKDLVNAMNNPKQNSAYYSKYNKRKRQRDEKAYLESDEYKASVDRDLGELAGDTAISLGKGGLAAGETVYAATDLASRIDNFIKKNTIDKIPGVKALREKLGIDKSLDQVLEDNDLAPDFGRVREALDSKKSETGKASRALVEKENKEYADEAAKEIQKKKNQGTYNKYIDAPLEIVKATGVSVKALANNPVAAIDTIIETVPQLLSGGAIGKAAINATTKSLIGKASGKEAAKILATKESKDAIAKSATKAGIANTVAMEASGAYLEARDNVLDTSFEDLAKDSKQYQEYIKDGMSPEAAREKLSYVAADISLATNMALAAVTSKVTGAGKFEGTLLSKAEKTAAKTAAGVARKAGARTLNRVGRVATSGTREGAEETMQGGGQQLIENIVTKELVDPTQDITKGVGQAAGEGLVAGFGSGAALSAPRELLSAAADVIGGTAKGVKKVAKPVIDSAQKARKTAKESKLSADELMDTTKGNYNPSLGMQKHRDEYSKLKTTDEKKEHLKTVLKPAYMAMRKTAEDLLQKFGEIEKAGKADTPIGQQLKTAHAELSEIIMEEGAKINALNQANKKSAEQPANIEEARSNVADTTTTTHASTQAVIGDVLTSHGSESFDSNYKGVMESETADPAVKEVIAAGSEVAKAEEAYYEEYNTDEISRVNNETLGDIKNKDGKLGAAAHIRKIQSAISSGNLSNAQAAFGDMLSFLDQRNQKIDAIQQGVDKYRKTNKAGERVRTGPNTTFTISSGSIKTLEQMKAERDVLKKKVDFAKAALEVVEKSAQVEKDTVVEPLVEPPVSEPKVPPTQDKGTQEKVAQNAPEKVESASTTTKEAEKGSPLEESKKKQIAKIRALETGVLTSPLGVRAKAALKGNLEDLTPVQLDTLIKHMEKKVAPNTSAQETPSVSEEASSTSEPETTKPVTQEAAQAKPEAAPAVEEKITPQKFTKQSGIDTIRIAIQKVGGLDVGSAPSSFSDFEEDLRALKFRGLAKGDRAKKKGMGFEDLVEFAINQGWIADPANADVNDPTADRRIAEDIINGLITGTLPESIIDGEMLANDAIRKQEESRQREEENKDEVFPTEEEQDAHFKALKEKNDARLKAEEEKRAADSQARIDAFVAKNEEKKTEVEPEIEPEIETETEPALDTKTTALTNTTPIVRKERVAKDGTVIESTESTATDIFKIKKTDSNSAFTKIHNFFSALRNPEGLKEIKEQYELSDAEVEQLQNIENWLNRFTKISEGLSKPRRVYNMLKDSPLTYFKDEEGKLEENVKNAIALAAFNWLATRSSDLNNYTVDDIYAFAGANLTQTEATGLFPLLRTLGAPRAFTVEDIGSEIRKQLNISALPSTEGNVNIQLETELGLLAVHTLNEMGLLDINSITNDTLNTSGLRGKAKAENTEIDAAALYFLKIPTEVPTNTPEGQIAWPQPIEPIQKIINAHKGDENTPGLAGVIKKVFSLFGSNDLPSTEPVKSTPQFMKGTNSELSPAVKTAVEEYQKIPYKIKKRIAHIGLNILNEKTFMEMAGYVDPDTVHSKQKESVEAVNKGLHQSYMAIKDFMESGQVTEEFFNEMSVWVNNRIGDAPTKISLQRDKMMRHIFGATAWDATVDLNSQEQINLAKVAIMEAFDHTADKTTEATLVKMFDRDFMDQTGQVKEQYAAAVAAVLKAADMETGNKLNAKEEQAIVDAVDEGGEAILTFDGLVALADLSQAIKNGDKSVDLQLGREVDGVTNGVIAAVLQLGVDINTAKRILIAGGLSFADVPDAVWNQFALTKELGARDNYQELALLINTNMQQQMQDADTPAERSSMSALMGLLSPLVNEDDTVTSAGRALSKQPLMLTIYGAGNKTIQADQVEKILEDIYKGMMKAKQEDGNNPQKPAQVAYLGMIGTMLPNTSFNMSSEKTLETLNEHPIEEWHFSLDENITVYDQDTQQDIQVSEMQIFEEFIGSSIGKATAEGTEAFFGNLIEHRDTVMHMNDLSSAIYTSLYNIAMQEAADKKGSMLTPEERSAVELKLRDDGVVPGAQHATSTGHNDSIQAYKTKKEYIPEEEGGLARTEFNKKLDITEMVLNNEGELVPNNKESSLASTSERGTRRVPIRNTGPMTFALLNQASDSNTQTAIMKKYPMLNVFDAFIIGMFDTKEIARDVNKQFLNVNAGEYNIATAVMEKMDILWSKFDSLPKKEQDAILVTLTPPVARETLTKNGLKGNVSKWRNTVEFIQSQNEIVHSNLLSSQQFPVEGGEYVMDGAMTPEGAAKIDADIAEKGTKTPIVSTPTNTPPSAAEASQELQDASDVVINQVPTGLNEVNNPEQLILFEEEQDTDPDSKGSDAEPMQDFTPQYEENLNAGTIEDTFNRLENHGNVRDSVSHISHLRGIITDLIKPVLSRMDDIALTVGETTGANKGLFERRTQGDKIYIAGSQSVLNSFANMSAQEILAHESVHAIWTAGIDINPKVKKELRRLFKLAWSATDANGNKVITAESFLRRDEDGNVLIAESMEKELEIAQARYDYVFNTKSNPNAYLHEFATIGLTNESFMKSLGEVDAINEDIEYSGSLINRLVQVFNNVMNIINRHKYTNTNGKIDTALRQLAQDTNQVQRASWSKFLDKPFVAFYGVNSVATKILANHVWAPYTKYVESRIGTGETAHPVRVVIDQAIGLPYNAASETFRENVNQVARNFGFTKDNMLYKVLDELRGPTELTQWAHNMLMQNNHDHDQYRERMANQVPIQIVENFQSGKSPSSHEWRQLNAALLKTDLGSLLNDYTLEQVAEFMLDEKKLRRAISQQRGKLNQYSTTKEYYKIQAKNLGHYMADGKSRIDDAMLNAFNIANLESVRIAPEGDLVAAEKIIDTLASLYAIQQTPSDAKKTAVKYITQERTRDSEENGITFLLGIHENFKTESLDKLFSGNKRSMVKGYTFEMYNPFRSMQVDSVNAEEEMKQQGYYLMETIKRDEGMGTVGPELAIYISKDGLLNRRVSGIVSTTNLLAKGSDLMSVYTQEGQVNDPRQAAHAARLRMVKKNSISVQRQLAGTTQLNEENNFLVPIVSPGDGAIGNYRYTMSETNKENWMGKNDQAHLVMGRMYGSLIDKVQTPKGNRAYAEAAKKDYDDHYNDSPEDFVIIGPNSSNEKHREIYRLLPDSMKRDIKDVWGGDDMFIREDTVDLAFGFRKASMTDFVEKQLAKVGVTMNHHVGRTLRQAGILWQAIVARQKRNIVLFLPSILFSNVLSNEHLLIMSGVPPGYSIKHQAAAISHINSYIDMQNEKESLERANKAEPNSPKFRRNELKIARLEKDLAGSPIAYLVDHGIFQNISEDIREDGGDLGRALSNIIPGWDKAAENAEVITPTFVKTGYKNAIIAPGTDLNRVLSHATQYSDFVARYTMFKYQTEEQGISKEQALTNAVDTFINYDVPTSPEMQWLNDMGIMQFTKFLFRIQRIILRRATGAPATLAASTILQQGLGDSPDIYDGILTPASLLNRSPGPLAIIDRAANLNAIDQLDWADLLLPF